MRKTIFRRAAFSLLAAASFARADQQVQADKNLVIAGHPKAAEMGMAVLRSGGTAADALVTVSFALGVTEPGNSGLGGKIGLLYYDAATKKVTFIAGLGAASDTLDVDAALKLTTAEKNRGWKCVCVPGLPATIGEAHARWGTKPWKSLVDPVVKLADEGVAVSPLAAEMMSEFPAKIDPEAARIYARDGKLFKAGEQLKNPDLANTLRLIADGGVKAFYEGEPAEKIAAAVQAGGGWMTVDDFKKYKPRVLEPIVGEYKGLTVYSSPPPFSGGSTVLTALGILNNLDFGDAKARDAKYIDLVGRAMQQAYPEVTRAAGDAPDSRDRVLKILAPEKLKEMAKAARETDLHASATTAPTALTPSPPYGGEGRGEGQATLLTQRFNDLQIRLFGRQRRESGPSPLTPALSPVRGRGSSSPASADAFANLALSDANALFGSDLTLDDTPEASTTHLLIIDAKGNIACVTQSLGLHFGAAVVAPGTGVLLNGDLSNFSYNAKGVNYVAPGRWPRSTMSPTLFFKDGKPLLAIGSPAGARIPVLVTQVALDVVAFDRPLKEAIAAPRFHVRRATTKADPQNIIDLEEGSSPELAEQLKAMGWDVKMRTEHDFYFGAVNAGLFLPDGHVTGVADQRRTGDAAAN